MRGHHGCTGLERGEGYDKTEMRHGNSLFYGSREPCNNIQVPKADPLKSARHGVGIRFLNTKVLAAVGLRILDGVSPNDLHVSRILGIYYLVSQKAGPC